MGMSCFLVQNCTHFTKVSCFSVHFCSRPSQITWFACKFVYICVILCVGGAWGVWQFLWRVDVCMQIYGVFWEPFMGMSCFTLFSESRLWECRVFTQFAYRQVMFDCIFIGFAETRLWECRVFSFEHGWASYKSRVFPFTFAHICRQSHGLCLFFPVRAWAQGSLCPVGLRP